MMFIKLHDTENGKILALCDEKLINEVLTDDKGIELNIKDYRNFYAGKLIDASYNLAELISLDELLSANIIGHESVAYAIKNSIIQKGHVKLINKVPYAHAYKMK